MLGREEVGRRDIERGGGEMGGGGGAREGQRNGGGTIRMEVGYLCSTVGEECGGRNIDTGLDRRGDEDGRRHTTGLLTSFCLPPPLPNGGVITPSDDL